MSITVELDLPEPLAAKARAKGLLEPIREGSLLVNRVRVRLPPGRLEPWHDELPASISFVGHC